MKKVILLAVSILMAAYSYSQSSNNVFDNAVYARIGYGFPGGELKTNDVVTAGGQFEVGTIFYINSIKLADKLRLGVDVTYLSITGLLNMESSQNDNKTDSYFTAGLKVGPCVSYNLTGDLIGDVYFKIYPNMFIAGETENHNYNAENQTKIGTSFGLNLRYKAVMLGFELTSNKYDFDLPVAARTIQATETQAIKLPVSFLTLGVNL